MKRSILALVAVGTFLFPRLSGAQKVYRIGALVADDQFVPAFEGFKKKMAELGYSEGKNIRYDLQNAQGDRERLKKLAQKLVQDKPDLIVTSSTTATVPVAKLTEGTSLPVVFLSAGDPLRFVKSYASSGNNMTGISTSSLDLIEKRMDLLKEIVPGAKRVIALQVPGGVNYEAARRLTREAAKKLGLALVEVEAGGPEEIKSKISVLILRKLGEGVFVPPDAAVINAIEEIAQQAIREGLPAIGANVENVRRGLLASYSSDYYSLGQQGAVLADKVLRF